MDERVKEWMINLRKVGVEVRKFDYMKLADRLWDGEVVSYIAKIHECKGLSLIHIFICFRAYKIT